MTWSHQRNVMTTRLHEKWITANAMLKESTEMVPKCYYKMNKAFAIPILTAITSAKCELKTDYGRYQASPMFMQRIQNTPQEDTY